MGVPACRLDESWDLGVSTLPLPSVFKVIPSNWVVGIESPHSENFSCSVSLLEYPLISSFFHCALKSSIIVKFQDLLFSEIIEVSLAAKKCNILSRNISPTWMSLTSEIFSVQATSASLGAIYQMTSRAPPGLLDDQMATWHQRCSTSCRFMTAIFHNFLPKKHPKLGKTQTLCRPLPCLFKFGTFLSVEYTATSRLPVYGCGLKPGTPVNL